MGRYSPGSEAERVTHPLTYHPSNVGAGELKSTLASQRLARVVYSVTDNSNVTSVLRGWRGGPFLEDDIFFSEDGAVSDA